MTTDITIHGVHGVKLSAHKARSGALWIDMRIKDEHGEEVEVSMFIDNTEIMDQFKKEALKMEFNAKDEEDS